MEAGKRVKLVLAGISAFAAVTGAGIGLTSFATQIDNDVYDFLFRLHPVRAGAAESVVLAVDEATFEYVGGPANLRTALAQVWPNLLAAKPLLIAVDLTLTDKGREEESAELERQFARTPNLILASELMPTGEERWQNPLPRFAAHAVAVGHVHAYPHQYDSVTRAITLERVAGRERKWALALEAYRVSVGAGAIESSPTDVTTGNRFIRSRWDEGRPMRVRFRPSAEIPRVPMVDLIRNGAVGAKLADKAVFVGVTARSAGDRLFTPLSYEGEQTAGVEINAQAYETIRRGDFLFDAPRAWAPLLALLYAALMFVIAVWLQGWLAYASAGVVLLLAHLTPVLLFRGGLVLEPSMPLTAAWLAALGCLSYQHFFVRRRLRETEADKARYQQAIRFVTHEMRTPLTAIQGSSEMITRYKLTDDKRQQLGAMINSESKRLAQMITTFLNVEKLSAGQLELRRSEIEVAELVGACVERARPLAEKKEIRIDAAGVGGDLVSGDRELLEYAVYNLLTNAIKYSPRETEIRLASVRRNRTLLLSVSDQGIGMSENEVKRLFTKFYRTAAAEKSGEVGTGLGLSIVEQIVTHHGGRMQVASSPGKGSCFTMELPASSPVTAQ